MDFILIVVYIEHGLTHLKRVCEEILCEIGSSEKPYYSFLAIDNSKAKLAKFVYLDDVYAKWQSCNNYRCFVFTSFDFFLYNSTVAKRATCEVKLL